MNQMTVLISGATGGLGRIATQAFLNAGWCVQAACRTDAGAADLRDFTAHPALSTSIYDVSDRTQAKEFVASSLRDVPSGFQAVLCLAGGIQAGTNVEATNLDVLNAMLAQNLHTAWNLASAALPYLKQTGGSIVTIGARAASPDRPAEANKSGYAASKAALLALTRTIAEEGRAFGVRANCILPGILRTAANVEWGSPDDIKHWTAPEDVAAMMLHLCSDAGKAVTGAVIPMYAGLG
jgi:NAD(P)-dependent dehydrogenase (short-subunit alcohol dehydrogenase family)